VERNKTMSTNFILTEEQSSKTADQLSFDFQSIAEMNKKDKNAVKLNIPNSDLILFLKSQQKKKLKKKQLINLRKQPQKKTLGRTCLFW
jgi:hypothetical protein